MVVPISRPVPMHGKPYGLVTPGNDFFTPHVGSSLPRDDETAVVAGSFALVGLCGTKFIVCVHFCGTIWFYY